MLKLYHKHYQQLYLLSGKFLHSNVIEVLLVALYTNGLPTRTTGAERGCVVRTDNERVTERVGEIFGQRRLLVDVLTGGMFVRN